MERRAVPLRQLSLSFEFFMSVGQLFKISFVNYFWFASKSRLRLEAHYKNRPRLWVRTYGH